MSDISGFGMNIRLIAGITFPIGFGITEFADDTDPFDIPDIQMADKAMGLNGDLVVWSMPAPIEVSIAVVPDSDDDRNLALIADSNRIGKGKSPISDVITMTRSFPGTDEIPLTLTNGKMISAPAATSVAAAGRKKSKVYTFAFENAIGN